ncbi:MAG: glycoside hydrolase N-terminal domain-containing protein [Bacillota bacterium]
MEKNYVLKLDAPAEKWENTTPIGSGNLGATMFGHIAIEEIILNEESIWSKPVKMNYDNYAEKIDNLKSLVKKGDMQGADAVAETICPDTNKLKSYETGGRLLFKNLHVPPLKYDNYSRELDLINGICNIKYDFDGVKYNREYFASNTQNVMAFRFTSEAEKGINFTMAFIRDAVKVTTNKNIMQVFGTTQFGDMGFCIGIKVINEGGFINTDDRNIAVTNAKTATIFVRITTQFKSAKYKTDCMNALANDTDYDAYKAEHIAAFSSAMNRSGFMLTENKELTSLPINKRIKKVKSGEFVDDNLAEIYYQFGKYMLLSSSRNGGYPANLQGVWNDSLTPSWQSDYHININLQMNYWGADIANLAPETLQPLFDFMNNVLLPSGKNTAQTLYKSVGAVAHHATDIYGHTKMIDSLCGLWQYGLAWLCWHMWEHYLFTKDEAFLRNTAYECIKENVKFVLAQWEKDENGVLQSLISMSPENSYYLKKGLFSKKQATMTQTATMDIQIVSGLLKSYIATEDILNIDKKTKGEAINALSALPKLKIGADGRLLEWQEEYKEVEKGHRHISHAYALYPNNAINSTDTPAEFAAIRKSIEFRLQNGGGHTGWSRVWLIAMYARLKDGENAYKQLQLLFKKSTLPNLFDNHPPFQIDGNLGGIAVIAEMLLQSHEDFIELLPATPKKWLKRGEFFGLKARGNFEVFAKWENSKIRIATFNCIVGGTLKIHKQNMYYPTAYDQNDNVIPLVLQDDVYTINTKKGQVVILKCK